MTVVGERRMAVYDDMSDNERIRIYDIGVDPAEIDNPHLAHEMPVTYRTGDIISPFVPFREPLLVQDEHFVECIRTGAAVQTPGERGLEIVRVLAATDELSGSPAGRTVAGAAAATRSAHPREGRSLVAGARPARSRQPRLAPSTRSRSRSSTFRRGHRASCGTS